MGTDKDWEKWGASDPYYGVYSRDQFRANAITEEARTEFFASGEEHIAKTMQNIAGFFGPWFEPKSALDFGCGVGRLVIPLALRTGHATGVDISPSMLAEARQNCAKAQVDNVSFIESDDQLSQVTGSFDLVHSYIVLQHIAWRRGRTILQSLAKRVNPGGCLAVQISTRRNAPLLVRGLVRLRYAFPPINWARNLLRSRPMFEPAMQLHVYDLEKVRKDLRALGFRTSFIEEPCPGFRSTLLYAQRATTPLG